MTESGAFQYTERCLIPALRNSDFAKDLKCLAQENPCQLNEYQKIL
jgi:hypothetical protein